MSLLDNLNDAEQQKPTTKPCIVARQIQAEKLSDQEILKLSQLLWPDLHVAGTRVPTTHLARALRKSGIPVSDKSLERHRERDCSCNR